MIVYLHSRYTTDVKIINNVDVVQTTESGTLIIFTKDYQTAERPFEHMFYVEDKLYKIVEIILENKA